MTTCYLINITPSAALNGDTPYEKWHEKCVNYSNLRTFGCAAFSHQNQGKLEPRAKKCVFLGYPCSKNYDQIIHSETIKSNFIWYHVFQILRLNQRPKTKNYLKTKSNFVTDNPPDISHAWDAESVHTKPSRLQKTLEKKGHEIFF